MKFTNKRLDPTKVYEFHRYPHTLEATIDLANKYPAYRFCYSERYSCYPESEVTEPTYELSRMLEVFHNPGETNEERHEVTKAGYCIDWEEEDGSKYLMFYSPSAMRSVGYVPVD